MIGGIRERHFIRLDTHRADILGRAMHTIGRAERYVTGRDGNVVLVDFARPPDPPAPRFPGAGALRIETAEATEFTELHPLESRLAQRLA